VGRSHLLLQQINRLSSAIDAKFRDRLMEDKNSIAPQRRSGTALVEDTEAG
jgi:hypothetical protein